MYEGMKREEIEAAIEEAVEKGDTSAYYPIGDSFLDSVRQSAILYYIQAQHPEKKRPDGYTWNEIGMSELFSECYRAQARYCANNKSWYTYDGAAWVKDIDSLNISYLGKEFVELLDLYARPFLTDEKNVAFKKRVSAFGDYNFRRKMLEDAKEAMRISLSEFDKNPYLINCQDGTYDLKTGRARPASPDDFITFKANCQAFRDKLRFPRWEQFINEVTEGDKDKADYLQRALGYSIFGTAREECMFVLYGKSTRNGKSTLLDSINHLLGDYSTEAPVELICKGQKKSAEAANPVLANLKGRRFVTMAESDQRGKIDEAVLKQYTGGEEITARGLYQSPCTFLPQFTIWLSCNDLPHVEDKSIFASSRMRVIEFNRHFTNQEQNKDLKEQFRTPEAANAIMQWLIEGYLNYCEIGLREPDAVKNANKQYETDCNIVLQFLSENFVPDASGSLSCTDVYNRFKLWCHDSQYAVMSKRKFGSEIKACPGWKIESRKSGQYYYDGLKLA